MVVGFLFVYVSALQNLADVGKRDDVVNIVAHILVVLTKAKLIKGCCP